MKYFFYVMPGAYIASRGDLTEALIATIVGGLVVGFIAWVSKQLWESRKKKNEVIHKKIIDDQNRLRKSRKKLIADMRVLMQTDYNRAALISSDLYQQLKPYLTEECRKLFEKPGTTVVFYAGEGGSGRNIYRETMAENLANIEREWKLI